MYFRAVTHGTISVDYTLNIISYGYLSMSLNMQPVPHFGADVVLIKENGT